MSLREQLEAIHAEHGHLTPDLVVQVARPKTHPLHDRFEWDNKLAGDAWRREQAHRMIQSVRTKYTPAVGGPRDVRAFVAVPRPTLKAPSYEPIEAALADPLQRQIVLQAMEREWRTLKGRYEDVAEFSQMILAELAPEQVAS
jgi:hypothetical protein